MFTIIYLFILNHLENIKKINLTIFDHIFLFVVVFRSTTIIIGLISNLFSYYNYFELLPLYYGEGENANNNNETKTTREIVMTNGTWGSTVRSVFIYSTAALHMHLTRAPGRGFGKIGTAFGAFAIDAGGKFVENAINDPSYIRDHVKNWKMMWETDGNGAENREAVKVDVSADASLLNEVNNEAKKTVDLNNAATFVPSPSAPNLVTGPSGENNSELFSSINDLVVPIIKTLKPQQVGYSVELLMDQHHFIAVCLFIMTLSALFLFFVFLYNIVLFIYKDKILNYFTNKYIVLYLKLQFKILNIEIIFIALLIIYYFYFLIIGLHFLAIFPISVNI